MSVKVRKNRRGDGWEVDIIVCTPDGRKTRQRCDAPVSSKTAAQRWGEQREHHLAINGKAEKKKEVPTVAEFYPQCLTYSENNNKPSTAYAKKSIFTGNLIPVFGDRRLDQIGVQELEAYKNQELKEGYSKKTINNHLATLGKMLSLAKEWDLITSAPKMKLFRLEPSDFEFLTFEETPRFLAGVPPEWKTFALVPLKTGLRVGELLALKWEDLDLSAGRLMVRRTLWNKQEVLPKGGRVREVPLGNDVIAALKAHRHLRGPYVFCDEAGGRLTHSKVKRVVPGACAKAGLAKRLTTHDLRHSFASHLVMLGQSLKAVQELLGHTTIEMTMRYAHLSPDVKRDAVRLLDSLPVAKSSPAVEQAWSKGVEE
jgi:integrase